MESYTYTCGACGQLHEGLPFSYFIPAPAPWEVLSRRERWRSVLDEETCVIRNKEGTFYYIRGNIEIPVLDGPHPFSWTVWVSLSEANFRRAGELWEQPGRENEPPYFGWLGVELPYPTSTLHLKALVHTQPVGQRPLIEMEETDHLLAVEQRNGITLAGVQAIAEVALHG